MPKWTFLSNHGQVLLCIAHDPGVRLREIGAQVGITERAAHRIVGELVDAGHLVRKRNGRRNSYTITTHKQPARPARARPQRRRPAERPRRYDRRLKRAPLGD